MERVANYFAEIGFKVNRESVNSANRAFEEIEKRLSRFAKTSKESLGTLSVKVNLDSKSLDRVNRQIRLLERNIRPLNLRVNVPNSKANRAARNALQAPQASVKAQMDVAQANRDKALLDALGSVRKATLDVQKEVKTLNTTMARQANRRAPQGFPQGGVGGQRTPLGQRSGTDYGRRTRFGVTQSHTTNTSSGVGSTGLSRRSSSPFHNPLMLGGFTGSLTRYGLHALPLFGGVIGAQALTRAAVDSDRQVRSLNMAASLSGTGHDGDYYRAFLDRLGKDLGLASSQMVDSFTYMLNTTGGTALGDQLEQGFASIIRYTTVFGNTVQEQDAAIKAFSKLASKPHVTAEELASTPTENIPFIFRIAAETLAGGSTEKLVEMMRNKEFSPNIHLPMILQAMDREVAPHMQSYFDSPTYAKNEQNRLMDQWMTNFLDSGGTAAVDGFLRTLNQVFNTTDIPSMAGELVDRFSNLLQAAMLAPSEILDYIKGDFDYDNFMEGLFGERTLGDVFDTVQGTFEALDFGIRDIIDYFREDVKGLTPDEEETYKGMGTISQLIAKGLIGLGVSPESSIATADFVGTGASEAVKGYFGKMEEQTKRQVRLLKDLWTGEDMFKGQREVTSELQAREFIKNNPDIFGDYSLKEQRAILEDLKEFFKNREDYDKAMGEYSSEVLQGLVTTSPLDRLVGLFKGGTEKPISPQQDWESKLAKAIAEGTFVVPSMRLPLSLNPNAPTLANAQPSKGSSPLWMPRDSGSESVLESIARSQTSIDEILQSMVSTPRSIEVRNNNNIELNIEFSGAEVADEQAHVTAIRNAIRQEIDNINTNLISEFRSVIN